MRTASIFNIQRFSINDGPGIRTTVFFKGCPLNCLWCANPESQEKRYELEVFPNNCIGCGECIKTCKNGAISFGEDGVMVNRELCKSCGECAKGCYARALKYVGEHKTVDEVVTEISKDEVFYRNSGGGYTFSGGEPLSQGEFCLEVIEKCKSLEATSCIETSGFGNTEVIKKLAAELDLMFYDVKHMDSEIHKKLTGVGNELIIENLKAIQPYAKRIIVRTPIIPGYNDSDENIIATAELCKELSAVDVWELLPYHSLGEHKYTATGREYELAQIKSPTKESLEHILKIANDILQPVGKLCKLESSGMDLQKKEPKKEKMRKGIEVKPCGW